MSLQSGSRTVDPEKIDVEPGRREFLKRVGAAGLSTTVAMLFGDAVELRGQSTSANQDTANAILTAAVIAEDLATTFYYNGLVGAVI